MGSDDETPMRKITAGGGDTRKRTVSADEREKEFKAMNSKNAKKPMVDKSEDFYADLPLFVTGQSIEAVGAALPGIERIVERNGRQLTLTILPAFIAVADAAGGFQQVCRFPGEFEHLLEWVLRGLAVAGNVNFNEKNYLLRCSYRQLSAGITALGDSTAPTQDQIEIALSTLTSVNYILEYETTLFSFSPIQELHQTEKDGEIYYRLLFTRFFFDDSRLFDELFAD